MQKNRKGTAARFLASQNLSLFGSQLAGYAIIWHITLETASGLWLTLATLASMLPQVLVSLWGGVLADRYSRKVLIMLADGFIALATMGLAIAFGLGYRGLGLLLSVSAVRSVATGIQTPAVNAMYPQLVPAKQLTRVQGINQTLGAVSMLLAPAAGGVVLGSVGIVWALWIDVLTASLAILIMARLPGRHGAPSVKPQPALRALGEGIAYAAGRAPLRRLLICCAASYFLFAPAATLAPLLIERTFGGAVWRLTMNQIVWAGGSIAGGVFLSLRGKFGDKQGALSTALILFGLAFCLQAASGTFALYQALVCAAGFLLPVIVTVQTVIIQETAPPEMLGRVFALVQLMSSGAMPLAMLLFGPLADAVPVQAILLVTGAFVMLTGTLYRLGGRLPQAAG